ncbi:MAG: DUF4386 domain-containing protein [Schleiferiaceae bacterium]|nr:DUF4386 domain-containing protein [Schleiferiaceae bacterium]
MSETSVTNLQHKYAKRAGLSYVIFTLAGLINNFLLNSKLSKPDAWQANGFFENELHFRLGIVFETIMFLAVVTASVSFYLVLKPVHKPLSITSLCLRLCEIITGGMAVVISIAMLAFANRTYFSQLLDPDQLQAVIAVISGLRTPAYEYSWIFMGFAGVITFYLFFKTKYIPRAWSVWGMITYTSLILYPIAKVLIADLPREAMFVLFPGALFELGVGIWLMVKGIDRLKPSSV